MYGNVLRQHNVSAQKIGNRFARVLLFICHVSPGLFGGELVDAKSAVTLTKFCTEALAFTTFYNFSTRKIFTSRLFQPSVPKACNSCLFQTLSLKRIRRSYSGLLTLSLKRERRIGPYEQPLRPPAHELLAMHFPAFCDDTVA